MTMTEERAEEIADEVLEVLDDQIADLEPAEAIDAIEAVKSAIAGREDAVRDQCRRDEEASA